MSQHDRIIMKMHVIVDFFQVKIGENKIVEWQEETYFHPTSLSISTGYGASGQWSFTGYNSKNCFQVIFIDAWNLNEWII